MDPLLLHADIEDADAKVDQSSVGAHHFLGFDVLRLINVLGFCAISGQILYN